MRRCFDDFVVEHDVAAISAFTILARGSLPSRRRDLAATTRWLWVQIDKASKEIDVWLRIGLAFLNGGARQFKDHLTKLFIAGVEKYWSRSIESRPWTS